MRTFLHEFRSGELTQLGIEPYGPCVGASDTTQLWLILLGIRLAGVCVHGAKRIVDASGSRLRSLA
ncbi:hypothetical protein ACLQ24_20375 [Micromonospora sp. DT4]|uniref:hypothetical protein n=1 Tax=Micromonospora sp. DT4 TaxID=3393438 RepID=UPI003CEF6BA1